MSPTLTVLLRITHPGDYSSRCRKRSPLKNALFVELLDPVHASLRQRGWKYYLFIVRCARCMCSWKTNQEDAGLLLRVIRDAVASTGKAE